MGEQEKVEYDRFKVPKRKKEWMGSRLAVKKLIRACVPELAQHKLSQIQIIKEPSGAPFLQIDGEKRLPGWLSLSHSHEHVLAAYSPDEIRFGVDLEFIEPRSIGFVRDYFTGNEVDQVVLSGPDQKALIITIIWSAKEAVLKAITEGLRIDTRKIEISSGTESPNKGDWNVLELHCSAEIKIPSLRLLWRREGDFIQTLCVLENHNQKLVWVSI